MSDRIKLENLLSDDSFVRFIKGKTTGDEQAYWERWAENDPVHQNLLEQAHSLIRLTARQEHVIPDPEVEWKHLQRTVKNISRSTEYQNEPKESASGKGRAYWSLLTAAAVLIVITAGLLLNFGNSAGSDPMQGAQQVHSNSEHHTGFGEKAYLHLPDGSRIVMNANSHLTYLKTVNNTEGETRIEVFLEGEALFDISSEGEDARMRTFQVHTPHGNVEVTGTVFWVESTDHFTRTVLEEGEVKVHKELGSDAELPASLVLKPGDMAQFSQRHDLIEVKKVNTKLFTSWALNIWTFDQTPVREIAERIEKVFGRKVEISAASLKDKTLSGTIRSDNLQLIKEGLSEVLKEEVSEVGGTIYIGAR